MGFLDNISFRVGTVPSFGRSLINQPSGPSSRLPDIFGGSTPQPASSSFGGSIIDLVTRGVGVVGDILAAREQRKAIEAQGKVLQRARQVFGTQEASQTVAQLQAAPGLALGQTSPFVQPVARVAGKVARQLPGVIGGVLAGEAIERATTPAPPPVPTVLGGDTVPTSLPGGAVVGPPTLGQASGTGFRFSGQRAVRATPNPLIAMPSPTTGTMNYWRHVGTPVVFSKDLKHLQKLRSVSTRICRSTGAIKPKRRRR